MGTPKNPQSPIGDEYRGPWPWHAIADRIGMMEGKPISRERCRQVAEKALKKLRNALEEDPLVRDWMIENGYMRPD